MIMNFHASLNWRKKIESSNRFLEKKGRRLLLKRKKPKKKRARLWKCRRY